MKRLPFHSVILDPFTVLSLELTDDSLSRLLPIGKVLGLSSDKLYDHVIQQKVALLQRQIKTKTQSTFQHLQLSFNDFRHLLSKIKDHQQAISLCVYVGGNFPRGEGRIAAYRLASTISQKWITSLEKNGGSELEKAQTGAAKVKGMLNVAETEFALQTHGLQVYDKFVPKPSILLMQLLTLTSSHSLLAPDVYHFLAKDIAERSGVDLDKLKLMMLQVGYFNSSDGYPMEMKRFLIFKSRKEYSFCCTKGLSGGLIT
jgi:hypothetical protein